MCEKQLQLSMLFNTVWKGKMTNFWVEVWFPSDITEMMSFHFLLAFSYRCQLMHGETEKMKVRLLSKKSVSALSNRTF